MQGDLVFFFFFEITLGRSDQVQVQTLASREGLHLHVRGQARRLVGLVVVYLTGFVL
jgi:hypothetical protein